jgi:hypothetical protein
MKRELHMVYGANGIKAQGWQASAMGWKLVDPDDWPNGSYRVVEWQGWSTPANLVTA